MVDAGTTTGLFRIKCRDGHSDTHESQKKLEGIESKAKLVLKYIASLINEAMTQ